MDPEARRAAHEEVGGRLEHREVSLGLATINGQKLKVTGKGRVTDACLNGIYNATDAVFGFVGVECRHGHPIKNGRTQVVVFSCSIPPIGQPGPCAIATYSEVTLKRFAVRSEKDWAAAITFDGTQLASSITVTLDSFDGTILHGRFSGVYDDLAGTGNPPAAISGEGTFAVPMMLQ
jgi:hypothetical protein